MDAARTRATCAFIASTACLALLVTGCGSSGTHTTTLAPGTPTVTATETPTPTPTQTATVTSAGKLPQTCADLPQQLINTDIGGTPIVQPLRQSPTGVTCEFASADAKRVLIITVGPGNAGVLATARAHIPKPETVATVSGFEAGAFTVSRGGLVRGFTALSNSGWLVVVTSNFTLAQDEALVTAIAG